MVRIENDNIIIEIEGNGDPLNELDSLQRGLIDALQGLRGDAGLSPVYYLSVLIQALSLDYEQMKKGLSYKMPKVR